MSQRLGDYWVFWRQFRENFHTTGAVMPSGQALARSLVRHVGQSAGGQRVLEVGPGTGAVTNALVRALGPEDRLDLVELNDKFVANLRRRFEQDRAFSAVSARARVLHAPVEQLETEAPYDLIVSGLPLNNFSVESVENILGVFRRLLRQGGWLSFFEYIAIRSARRAVSGPAERARLSGIDRALGGLLEPHQAEREWVWINMPPAWVHHVHLPPLD